MTAELQRITRLFEKFFNKSSEQLPKDKASQDAATEEEQSSQTQENTAPNDNKGKRKIGDGGRNPLPPDLLRVENVVEHEVPVVRVSLLLEGIDLSQLPCCCAGGTKRKRFSRKTS